MGFHIKKVMNRFIALAGGILLIFSDPALAKPNIVLIYADDLDFDQIMDTE